MSKVYKVLSLSFLLCLSLVVAPFHISANGSLSAPFVGYNIYPVGYDFDQYNSGYTFDLDLTSLRFNCQSYNSSGACSLWLQPSSYDASLDGRIYASSSQTSTSTNQIWQVDLILDANYKGSVTITQSGNQKTYYVNGNKLSFTVINPSNYNTLTIGAYNLTLIESAEDREYLMWQYPVESFNFVSYWLGLGKYPIELYQDSYYTYPVFELNTNDQIWRSTVGSDRKHIIIFFIDKYVTASNYNNYISYPSEFNAMFESLKLVPLNNTAYGRIVKFTFTNTSSSSHSLKIDYIGADAKIMPIYSAGASVESISTDFALQYGLSNSLLDNIQIIANGTDSSASSQSDLAQSTDDFSSASNQLVTQEESFDTSMNTSLNNIDTNFDFGNKFGSKFLASADWVKVQYDNLTRTTPFGSVIGFSLLLGLALLLVGRVLR